MGKKNNATSRLYRKNRKLELLNELILEISYKKDVDELLNSFLKKICKIINADFGLMTDLNETKNKKYNFNFPNELSIELENSNEIEKELNVIIDKNKYIDRLYKNDVIIIETENISNEIIRNLTIKYNIKSVALVPLVLKDKGLKGVIRLYSLVDSKLFYKHKSFLKAVGNALSILYKEQTKVLNEQNRIIKNEKLKLLGEMAGGIAHDFNNVLTSIIGYTQMALYSKDIDKIKKYLDIIYKSSLDGKAIVNKIQKFTKNKISSEKSLYNLNELVLQAIEMTKPKWKNECEIRNISINVFKEMNSSSFIYCNEYEIRETLINIIINAVDAMPKGGNLVIRTFDVKDKCCIEIEDSGIGIPNQELETIFEPFFTTKKSRGTGLGLSIVKNIISEHNGEIYVESKINKGTKFKIEFTRSENNILNENELNGLIKYPNLKALIIDDKTEVADSIGGTLNILEIKYDILIDCENVLDKVLKNDYDFVLCDLAMPKLNGIEVANIVKQHKNIKFILVTGWPENIKRNELKNVDYIIEKPFTILELSRVIKEMF